MGSDDDRTPTSAAIVLKRRVEWIDTDAAGIAHWLTCLRLVDIAEAAMHTSLGIVNETIGALPRLAATVDYHGPLRFNDLAVVSLSVDRVGRTSMHYAFAIDGPSGPAATGTLAVCLLDTATNRPTPWPDDVRAALESGGPQAAGTGRR